MTPDTEPLLTASECAALLGVTRQRVYQLRDRLGAVVVRRGSARVTCLFPREHVLAYAAARDALARAQSHLLR